MMLNYELPRRSELPKFLAQLDEFPELSELAVIPQVIARRLDVPVRQSDITVETYLTKAIILLIRQFKKCDGNEEMDKVDKVDKVEKIKRVTGGGVTKRKREKKIR